jgi:nicotinate phosphoribosyltransferase
VIGGADSTSNVYSAFMFGLRSAGTQAHSWIQSYDDEITAFRDFATAYPKNCVLLVDTYDTLKSGIPNAIIVAREMEGRGERLFGVRLDSGDLAYLSKKARALLDNSGLQYVRIVTSNQLDEYVISSLLAQGAPIDGFGVGTNLVTGRSDAALDGVYKLSMSDDTPRLKISETPEKIILPGIKEVFRFTDADGFFRADCISQSGETDIDTIYHPHRPDKSSSVASFRKERLFRKVMDKGKIVIEKKPPGEIAKYVQQRLACLPDEHKRFDNPHVYKVGISQKLRNQRAAIIEKIRERYRKEG